MPCRARKECVCSIPHTGKKIRVVGISKRTRKDSVIRTKALRTVAQERLRAQYNAYEADPPAWVRRPGESREDSLAQVQIPEALQEEVDDGADEVILRMYRAAVTGLNVCLIGAPGVGKSHHFRILTKYLKELDKFATGFHVLGMTHAATRNVDGESTFHSYMGLGLFDRPLAECLQQLDTKPFIKRRIAQSTSNNVSEAFMMTAEVAQKDDEVHKFCKPTSHNKYPFGGTHQFWEGDPMQLLGIPEEKAQYRYLFDAPVFQTFKIFTCVFPLLS